MASWYLEVTTKRGTELPPLRFGQRKDALRMASKLRGQGCLVSVRMGRDLAKAKAGA